MLTHVELTLSRRPAPIVEMEPASADSLADSPTAAATTVDLSHSEGLFVCMPVHAGRPLIQDVQYLNSALLLVCSIRVLCNFKRKLDTKHTNRP